MSYLQSNLCLTVELICVFYLFTNTLMLSAESQPSNYLVFTQQIAKPFHCLRLVWDAGVFHPQGTTIILVSFLFVREAASPVATNNPSGHFQRVESPPGNTPLEKWHSTNSRESTLLTSVNDRPAIITSDHGPIVFIIRYFPIHQWLIANNLAFTLAVSFSCLIDSITFTHYTG